MSLQEELTITTTVDSLEEYIRLVKRLFLRHKKIALVKAGDPIFAGDCYKTLSEAEATYVFRRDEKHDLQFRPGVEKTLIKTGIIPKFLKHDILEKAFAGERLLTFAAGRPHK